MTITNETVNVCDFCLEEVRSCGPDSVYYCDDHGCVEAYWHTVTAEEYENVG